MARGWESKSVEMQIEEHAAAAATAGNQKQDAGLQRQLDVLDLTRLRMQREWAMATHPRLREQKQKALDHLDAQIAQLRPDEPPR